MFVRIETAYIFGCGLVILSKDVFVHHIIVILAGNFFIPDLFDFRKTFSSFVILQPQDLKYFIGILHHRSTQLC